MLDKIIVGNNALRLFRSFVQLCMSDFNRTKSSTSFYNFVIFVIVFKTRRISTYFEPFKYFTGKKCHKPAALDAANFLAVYDVR